MLYVSLVLWLLDVDEETLWWWWSLKLLVMQDVDAYFNHICLCFCLLLSFSCFLLAFVFVNWLILLVSIFIFCSTKNRLQVLQRLHVKKRENLQSYGSAFRVFVTTNVDTNIIQTIPTQIFEFTNLNIIWSQKMGVRFVHLCGFIAVTIQLSQFCGFLHESSHQQ